MGPTTWGRARTIDYLRRFLWCGPSSWTSLLKVVHLPEGGSGTVDKGGEDLFYAVLLHEELLQVVLLPEGVHIGLLTKEERLSMVQSPSWRTTAGGSTT